VAENESEPPSIFDVFEPPPEVDPQRFGPIPVVPGEGAEAPDLNLTASESPAGLPHWTAPPTGQVPQVLGGEKDQVWSDLKGPSWHGEDSGWTGDDLSVVFAEEDSVEHEDLLAFDEPDTKVSQAAAAAAAAAQEQDPDGGGGDRNLVQAVAVGVGLAALAVAALLIGPLAALALIALVTGVASIELLDAMRKAGTHPAVLFGISAAVAMPLAAYAQGEQAIPLVMGLTIVFGFLWYLAGADTHRPVLNLGLTMFNVFYIGGLAAFGALMLTFDNGNELLLATIAIVAASDIGAYFGGKQLGNKFIKDRMFHPASPKKTWEGVAVGVVAAVAAAVALKYAGISNFSDSLTHAILLGLLLGMMAPIGDLAESLTKRDLGVKDMGTLLPGHGGILDRVDGLLFALPAAFYLARVLELT
jgi:phosphatidate cytidylyltransferase